MHETEFDGETYRDDRMYILDVCKCTVDDAGDGTLVTWICHEEAPANHKWCVATYRNASRYAPVRVDHFDSSEAAHSFKREVEPGLPLVSLGGREPRAPLPYDEFVKWKAANKFKEFDYKELYSDGGTNPQTMVMSRKR